MRTSVVPALSTRGAGTTPHGAVLQNGRLIADSIYGNIESSPKRGVTRLAIAHRVSAA